MAVQQNRTGWLALFEQYRRPTGFLSRKFTVNDAGAFFNGDSVVIDIEKTDETVAPVVVKDGEVNLNQATVYATKTFTPPMYAEGTVFNILSLYNREVGEDPYSSAYQDYAMAMMDQMARDFAKVEHKLERSLELQASQILQTGKLELKDKNGTVAFEADFDAKATHFPQVTTSWSDASATPLVDIENLAKLIRQDGKVTPDEIYMGSDAWTNFLNNAEVKAQLDNRRIEIGEVVPTDDDSGATHQAMIRIGSYKYDVWTYPEYYTDETGAQVSYIGKDNVIICAKRTRLDRVFAMPPKPLNVDPRVANFLPNGIINSIANGISVMPNVWCNPEGTEINGSLKTRPMLIPVQVDGFGCINTVA